VRPRFGDAVPRLRANSDPKLFAVLVALALAAGAQAASAQPLTDAELFGPEVTKTEPKKKPARLNPPRPAHVAGAAVQVRRAPDPGAKVVRTFRDLRRDFRVRTIQVLGQKRGSDGELWYRVALPGRPNGDSGFVPAERLDLRPPTRFSIAIDRSARTLELRRGRTRVMRTRVAVGKPGAETPLGRFHLTASFRPTAPILGSHALETSAYSRISDWPGGGIVGIHGTPNPELLGQAVSHGCVRMHNRDILRLRKLAEPGTPIRIVA
jgi:lipoprotein-anchoring transpeptidase ErfK/SrfK